MEKHQNIIRTMLGKFINCPKSLKPQEDIGTLYQHGSMHFVIHVWNDITFEMPTGWGSVLLATIVVS